MKLAFALLALTAVACAQAPAFREMRKDLRERTPILTYHDVIERRDAKALWFDCTTQELKDQLDWLAKRKAVFISLDQLYDHLVNGRPLPPTAVAITFADNYRGFYDRAWPILKARRIPVAMFVHTGYVGNQIGRPKMTWDQLKELQRSGLVTVASQTVSHPADLRTLTTAQLDKEMATSRRSLRVHLGIEARYLAYPNGKWNQRSVEAARHAGYLMAFTEDQRPAQKGSSILAIPRYVHTKYAEAWRDCGRR